MNKTRKIAVAIASVSLIVCLCVFKKANQIDAPKEPNKELPHERSDAELKKFWADELNDLIYEQLTQNKLPYIEVNNRFNDGNLLIFKRSHKALALDLSTKYHWAALNVEASAKVHEDGSANITMFVPPIMDVFETLRDSNQPNWHEAFRFHAIIVFMHEMEHTRSDICKVNHIDISEESRAWAETCRYIIDPLVSKYDAVLLLGDLRIYLAWKQSGGDTKSTQWIEAIRNLYGDLDGRAK